MRNKVRERSLFAKERGPNFSRGGRRSGDEWIYGLNPVLEAVRAGRRVKSVFLSVSRRGQVLELEHEIASRGITLKKAEQSYFDAMFPKGHQGVAAVVEPREYARLEEVLGIPALRNEAPFFVVLDCIEDPRNFGAILRTADSGGVHGVVIQSHRSATLVPEAVKASAGAAEYVSVAMVSNVKHAMAEMKAMGVFLLGAEAGRGRTIWDVDLEVPLALVIGSEGRGLRRTVKEDCDELAGIPMMGRVNSLNVSVAAAVMIYEVMRQRMRNH